MRHRLVVDLDRASVPGQPGRRHRHRRGLDRARAGERGRRRRRPTDVAFLFADGAGREGAGRYDLVTIFEAVHDMARPVEVLAAARRLLAPGGAVLIGDERVGDAFTAPGDEIERMIYAYSVVVCLPNGLADQPSVGTGTVLRPATLEAMRPRGRASRGSPSCPPSTSQFRFYRLDP